MVCSALVCLVVAGSAPIARGADRPSTEDAYAVYQQVDRWLRQNALPARDAPREARAIDPDRCDGAAVVLRLSGQVIGRSEVIDETGTAVWQAATAAWERAYPVLIEDLPNDALYEDRLQERMQRFTIDLQLAGPLVPLPSETFSGAGVLEIVEDHAGNTYRAVYTVRFAAAVYTLHAFQKKSKKGIATPKPHIELIKRRLKQAEQHYTEWIDHHRKER